MIRKDYLYHFLAGVLIAGLTMFFFPVPMTWDPNWNVGFACIFSLIAAVGKELIWDKLLGKGTPEVYDVFCTMAGGWSTAFILGILL